MVHGSGSQLGGRAQVLVQVVGSDLAGGCDCGGGCCGPVDPRPLSEQVADLEAKLQQHYGTLVQVEYMDSLSQEAQAYAGVLKLIEERGFSLPLVVVNGQPKLAGGLPLDAISEEVEKCDPSLAAKATSSN